MNAKHTPGPWTANGSETTSVTWVSNSKGHRICTMQRSEFDWSNALLIAASPNLLVALEAIIKMIGPYAGQGRMDAEISNARAAIAKAKGE